MNEIATAAEWTAIQVRGGYAHLARPLSRFSGFALACTGRAVTAAEPAEDGITCEACKAVAAAEDAGAKAQAEADAAAKAAERAAAERASAAEQAVNAAERPQARVIPELVAPPAEQVAGVVAPAAVAEAGPEAAAPVTPELDRLADDGNPHTD